LLVEDLHDEVGAFLQDPKSVTLKVRPFLDDGVVVAISDRPKREKRESKRTA
jgi:hypothetical protein